MTKWMRYFVLTVFCLMSLAFAGPVSAARAAGLVGCIDSPTSVQSGPTGGTDCDKKGQNKVNTCDHDACCGYLVVGTSEVRGLSTLPSPRLAIASVTKHLTATGRETLLDPPRI